MKLGDGLFLQCCKDVAALYPNIEFDQVMVMATVMMVLMVMVMVMGLVMGLVMT